MWRRDGSSLLQKYLKATEDDNDKDILFKASSVVSFPFAFRRSNDCTISIRKLLNKIPVLCLRLQYSCWEEKRKHDFFEIKVQCVGDKKDGVVKVLDVEELTKFALEDRPMIDTGINEEEGGEGDENEEDEDEGDEPEDEE